MKAATYEYFMYDVLDDEDTYNSGDYSIFFD